MYELRAIDSCGDEYVAREFRSLASARKFVRNFFEDTNRMPIPVGEWMGLSAREWTYVIKIEKQKTK